MKNENINIRVGKEEKNIYIKTASKKRYGNLSEFILAVLRRFYASVDNKQFKD